MAKRYIDAEQFLKDQTKKWGSVPWIGTSIHDYDSLPYALLNTPTADVVDVVSCKDCKHFCEYSNEYKSNVEGADGDCFIRCLYSDNEQFIGVKCDDFCSYGERRTDDD